MDGAILTRAMEVQFHAGYESAKDELRARLKAIYRTEQTIDAIANALLIEVSKWIEN